MANFFSDNKDLQFHLQHPMMRKIVELKFTIEPNDSLGVLAHRIDTLYKH